MKAVFFDLGRTLVEHPEEGAGEAVVRRYGITDEAEVKLVRDVLFSLKGAMKSLDDASISREEYSAQVLASVPKRLWEATEKAMEYPIEWLPDIEGMEKLLCDLYHGQRPNAVGSCEITGHNTAKAADRQK